MCPFCVLALNPHSAEKTLAYREEISRQVSDGVHVLMHLITKVHFIFLPESLYSFPYTGLGTSYVYLKNDFK